MREATRDAVLARDGEKCKLGPMFGDLLWDSRVLAQFTEAEQDDLLQAWRSCQQDATIVHEPGARSRDIGSQYDPDRCVSACVRCHDWAHANPAMAKAAGATT